VHDSDSSDSEDDSDSDSKSDSESDSSSDSFNSVFSESSPAPILRGPTPRLDIPQHDFITAA